MTNVVTIGLTIPILWFGAGQSVAAQGPQWMAGAIAIVMVVNTVVDYKLNYDHYFELALAPEWISARQANQAMQQIIQLLDFNSALPSPPPDADEQARRDWLERCLREVFLFMIQPDICSELFQRRNCRGLHVGIYIESRGHLCPVFRWAPPEFTLNNRKFLVGRSFIGAAYSTLSDKPDSALVYDSAKNAQVDASEPKATDTSYYKSSVLANVFWPPASEAPLAIGTLVITSDEENYFTPTVHEPLIVALSREVSIVIGELVGAQSEPHDAKERLRSIVGDQVIAVHGTSERHTREA